MEWTGSMGYMFAIKQVKDIYVAKSISTLLMPSYLEELLSFEETLNCLYAWRDHHLSLKETMLPALRKCYKDVSCFQIMLYIEIFIQLGAEYSLPMKLITHHWSASLLDDC
ncbi:uncharacterized protein EV154DRAFT_482273 [Mucor mucedo]|uniref:uncharacterized protein n=1 Tax=Mucor mucedo TaxID=29922 RepID=UPI00221F7AE8|nr:uncharacterized protein EV154DRAFT_482273 [Mucor mucedo]KAI7890284.1 hypothetical protein EV154DRAFT_482273 [Mucor mucedo]